MDIVNYPASWIAVNEIALDDRQFQSRKNLADPGLAQSLSREGQKFPVILRQRRNGGKQIISGLRRVFAAHSLGWEKVLARVIPDDELDDEHALAMCLEANTASKTLSNLDLAYICKRLKDEHRTNDAIGKLIGKSEAQVRRYVRIGALPDAVQDQIRDGILNVADIIRTSNRRDDAFFEQNGKILVKLSKYGFTATLKYDRNSDGDDIVEQYFSKIKSLFREQRRIVKKGVRVKKTRSRGGTVSHNTAEQPVFQIPHPEQGSTPAQQNIGTLPSGGYQHIMKELQARIVELHSAGLHEAASQLEKIIDGAGKL